MSQAFPQEHPSPHRHEVGLPALLFSLAAGPTGWITQLLLGYGLSSYACFPKDEPYLASPPPGWGGEHLILLAINLCCLGLVAAGFLVALASWRRTQAEKEGGAHHMLEVGEGRTRFLSLCGILACGLFGSAILFDTLPIVGTPACWNIAG
jgi:hypothetical protein